MATSSVRSGTAPRETAQSAAARTGADQETAAGWLIAPYVDPFGQGRDSLRLGASPGEVAAVVAADKAVQREQEARWSYLQGAYRDPHAGRAAMGELVKRQGWTSAAARVAREPEQFGELRGKERFFAGGKARAERGWRTGVEAQRAADATGIPRLSAAQVAGEALRGLAYDVPASGGHA